MATLPDLLKQTVELGGSDLHLSIGSPPQVRVHGELQKLEHPDLTPSDTKSLAYAVLTDAQKKRFEETLELDFSFGIKGMARAANGYCVALSVGEHRHCTIYDTRPGDCRRFAMGGAYCRSERSGCSR